MGRAPKVRTAAVVHPATRLLVYVVAGIAGDKEQEMLSRAARELVAEGEARGEAKALTRILERRFRALPEDVLKRIGSAASSDLESWLDRAVDAPSLEEVFSGPTERARH